MIETIPTDPNLVDICQTIVAGLDKDVTRIPRRYLQGFRGDLERALGFVVSAATRNTCDLLQNDRYLGGKIGEGTYGFGIYLQEEDERPFQFVLTETLAREIADGHRTQINVEYEDPNTKLSYAPIYLPNVLPDEPEDIS